MRTSFTFNSQAAERADAPSGIRTSGAYTMIIGQCAWRQGRDSQAEFVDFVLVDTATGAKVLTNICTNKKDGSENFGMGQFLAILGLLGIENAQITPDKVFNLSGQSQPGYRIKAVERKTLGFVLQYVEDRDEHGYVQTNERGYAKFRMVIKTAFDPQTKRTFSEVKNDRPAKRVESLLATLEDDKAKVRPASAGDGFESAPRARQNAPQSAADVAEDIPF